MLNNILLRRRHVDIAWRKLALFMLFIALLYLVFVTYFRSITIVHSGSIQGRTEGERTIAGKHFDAFHRKGQNTTWGAILRTQESKAYDIWVPQTVKVMWDSSNGRVAGFKAVIVATYEDLRGVEEENSGAYVDCPSPWDRQISALKALGNTSAALCLLTPPNLVPISQAPLFEAELSRLIEIRYSTGPAKDSSALPFVVSPKAAAEACSAIYGKAWYIPLALSRATRLPSVVFDRLDMLFNDIDMYRDRALYIIPLLYKPYVTAEEEAFLRRAQEGPNQFQSILQLLSRRMLVPMIPDLSSSWSMRTEDHWLWHEHRGAEASVSEPGLFIPTLKAWYHSLIQGSAGGLPLLPMAKCAGDAWTRVYSLNALSHGSGDDGHSFGEKDCLAIGGAYTLSPLHYRDATVTATIHMTIDRRTVVDEAIRLFGGPISVALFASKDDLVNLFEYSYLRKGFEAANSTGNGVKFFKGKKAFQGGTSQEELFSSSVDVRRYFNALHYWPLSSPFLLSTLVAEPQLTKSGYYPVNSVRNHALSLVSTPYALYLDADFLPRSNLWLELEMWTLHRYLSPARTLWVIPAFEGADVFSSPAIQNFENLLLSVGNREVQPVIWRAHPSTHFYGTNYPAWYKSAKPYFTWYRNHYYEPYTVFLRSCAPPFDERFDQFGWDKAQFILGMKILGGGIVVTPEAYIIHQEHKKAKWSKRIAANDKEIKQLMSKRIKSYLQDMQANHYLRTCPRDSLRLKQQYLNGDPLFDMVGEYKRGRSPFPEQKLLDSALDKIKNESRRIFLNL